MKQKKPSKETIQLWKDEITLMRGISLGIGINPINCNDILNFLESLK